jgi:H+-transporting ATPase
MIPGESTDAQRGLTTKDVEARLLEYGPNRIAEEHSNLWLSFLRKFWAPVPWMLEAAIILQLVLGKSTEAIIVAALLVFNAILSFSQEGRARQALTLLRSRMDVQARVLRDGLWQIVPARNLVPGDVVHLRMGTFLRRISRCSMGASS